MLFISACVIIGAFVGLGAAIHATAQEKREQKKLMKELGIK